MAASANSAPLKNLRRPESQVCFSPSDAKHPHTPPTGGTSKTWWQLVSSRLTVRRKVGVSCSASPVTHPEWVAITRIPRPLSAPRRPPPAVRRRDRRRADGDARRAEATASLIGAGPAGGQRTIPECAVNPGTSAGGHFTGMPLGKPCHTSRMGGTNAHPA